MYKYIINVCSADPVGYHFTTYHSYPTYYSPFPDYHPIVPFGAGLAVGMSLNNHHHHYYDYDRPSTYHYHHIYNNNNNGGSMSGGGTSSSTTTTTTTVITNSNSNSNGNNTANGNNPNANANINSSGPNENIDTKNANYLNNGPNTGANQNMQNNQSDPNNVFESPPPMVYSISGQNKMNEDDSTEIVFSNSYLIVGVESLLLYGEFHDDEDIVIIIEQDSDGLDPYEWEHSDPISETNATSASETVPNESQTVANSALDINGKIDATTIKIPSEYLSTTPLNIETTTNVPLAPLAALASLA